MEPNESQSVERDSKVVPEVEPVTEDAKSVGTTEDFRSAVKTRLAAQNDEIKAAVVDKMVSEEKQSRVSLLEQAFTTLTGYERDLKKISPDILQLSEAGEERKYYSPEASGKRKDLLSKTEKLEFAVNKAIKEKDWGPLKQLVKSDTSPKG